MLLNNNTTTATYVSSTGSANNLSTINTTTATYVSSTGSATNNLSTITIPQGYIGSGTIITSGTSGSIFYSSSISMIEIEVLGKKFTVYPDTIQQTYLAQIDFLGIGYWESLKKMSVSPISNEEIKNFLDKKLKSWQRQQKIKKITDES